MLDFSEPDMQQLLNEYVDIAMGEFFANNGTIDCPDVYATNILAVCSQVNACCFLACCDSVVAERYQQHVQPACRPADLACSAFSSASVIARCGVGEWLLLCHSSPPVDNRCDVQVVAGTNYKIGFRVTCPQISYAFPLDLITHVYQPLPGSNEIVQVSVPEARYVPAVPRGGRF